MKAILEFNLPDDQDEYERVNKALDLCGVLFDFDQYLRSEIKYHDKDLQDVRDKLYELMDSYNINLDKIYS